jgi:Na+/pantothenate symporter
MTGWDKERTKLLIARLCVLFFGIIAYALALTAEGVYALVEQASALGSSGALVVICFGLFSGFGGATAALTTLVLGTIAYTALSAAGATAPFLASLLISFIAYCTVAVIERRARPTQSATKI